MSNYRCRTGTFRAPLLALHALLNHTSKFITDSGIIGQPITESAGNMTLGAATASNVPLWKGFFTQDYANDLWGVTLTERWISDGVFNKMYVACTTGCPAPTVAHPTININRQDGALYFDIGGRYRLRAQNPGVFQDRQSRQRLAAAVAGHRRPELHGVNPGPYYDAHRPRMYRIGVQIWHWIELEYQDAAVVEILPLNTDQSAPIADGFAKPTSSDIGSRSAGCAPW